MVHLQPLPALVDDFSAHDRHHHIRSVHGMNDKPGDVVRRNEMRLSHIHDTEIGGHTFGDSPRIMQTERGGARKGLKPGEAPKVCFSLCEGDEVEAVYEYCNLHGLWKTSL